MTWECGEISDAVFPTDRLASPSTVDIFGVPEVATFDNRFQEDAIGIRLRDVIGVDNMMCGSDYSHSKL